jgi:hypothetical protein
MNLNSSFVHDCQRPGHLTLGVVQPGGVVELTGGVLEAEAEQLTTSCVHMLEQLTIGEIA